MGATFVRRADIDFVQTYMRIGRGVIHGQQLNDGVEFTNQAGKNDGVIHGQKRLSRLFQFRNSRVVAESTLCFERC